MQLRHDDTHGQRRAGLRLLTALLHPSQRRTNQCHLRLCDPQLVGGLAPREATGHFADGLELQRQKVRAERALLAMHSDETRQVSAAHDIATVRQMPKQLHVVELAIEQVNQVALRQEFLDGIDRSLGLLKMVHKRQRLVAQRRQNPRLSAQLSNRCTDGRTLDNDEGLKTARSQRCGRYRRESSPLCADVPCN